MEHTQKEFIWWLFGMKYVDCLILIWTYNYNKEKKFWYFGHCFEVREQVLTFFCRSVTGQRCWFFDKYDWWRSAKESERFNLNNGLLRKRCANKTHLRKTHYSHTIYILCRETKKFWGNGDKYPSFSRNSRLLMPSKTTNLAISDVHVFGSLRGEKVNNEILEAALKVRSSFKRNFCSRNTEARWEMAQCLRK